MSLFAAVALAAALNGQTAEATPDWAAVLRTDAQAVHDVLQDSHPGPYDDANPEFRQGLDAGLERALAHAETVRDVGGYWWALREYVASFNDGHTALSATDKLPDFPTEWPGFSTSYRDGRHVVTVRGIDEAPPQGAVLIACDGMSADALAAENIGRFRGLWTLNTHRIAFGDQLLWQVSNPYLIRPKRCDFEAGGRMTSHVLNWRPFDEAAQAQVKDQLAQLQTRVREPIGIRRFGPRQYWITASDFDSDPVSENGRTNTAMIEEIGRRARELRSADRIVLDLRGNNGGSSQWSREMALRLWGKAYVEALPPSRSYVEWRVSDANIAHMESIRERFRGTNRTGFEWAERMLAGMQSARAQGQRLWRQTPSGQADEAPAGPPPANPVTAKVYVLTDYYCGSACLDAADLWLALGAVQIGEETFADSQYMEVRVADLPSGYGRLVVPTKVYRDRPRAPGQTLVPTYPRAGPLTDTATLEWWVTTLP